MIGNKINPVCFNLWSRFRDNMNKIQSPSYQIPWARVKQFKISIMLSDYSFSNFFDYKVIGFPNSVDNKHYLLYYS